MALPTFQSININMDNATLEQAFDLTSLGLAEGDALLVLTSEDTNPDGHVVTGNNSGSYTFLHEITGSSPTNLVAWQVMGATPDTTLTINVINLRAQGLSGIVVKIPDVDTSNPLDATIQTAQDGSGMPDPPALTTVTAGAVRIITGHLDDDQVAEPTAPSGFEQLIWNADSANGNTTTFVAFREEPTPGTLDPGPFVGNGTIYNDDQWWATHLAVNLNTGGGGAAQVNGTGIASAPAVGAASVTAEASVSGTGLTGAAVLAAAVVTAIGAVTGADLTTGAPTVGAASVSAQAQVAGHPVVSAAQVGQATVTGLVAGVVDGQALQVAASVGAAAVVAEATVSGAGVHSAPQVGAAAVTGQVAGVVAGQGVQSAVAMGAAAVLPNAPVAAPGVQSAPAVGQGAVTYIEPVNPGTSTARVTQITAVGRTPPAVTAAGRPELVAVTSTGRATVVSIISVR